MKPTKLPPDLAEIDQLHGRTIWVGGTMIIGGFILGVAALAPNSPRDAFFFTLAWASTAAGAHFFHVAGRCFERIRAEMEAGGKDS